VRFRMSRPERYSQQMAALRPTDGNAVACWHLCRPNHDESLSEIV